MSMKAGRSTAGREAGQNTAGREAGLWQPVKRPPFALLKDPNGYHRPSHLPLKCP